MSEEKHRDFDISLTCGLMGYDLDDDYNYSNFTTIELENLYLKACGFKEELFKVLVDRPEYKD